MLSHVCPSVAAAPLTLPSSQRHGFSLLSHCLMAMVMAHAIYALMMRGLSGLTDSTSYSYSISFQMSVAFLLIGVGYVLERVPGRLDYDFILKGFSAGCYTAVIGAGLQGMLVTYSTTGSLFSHSDFTTVCCFLPDLMLVITGYLALACLLLPRTAVWAMVGIQIPAFLLVSIALSCLLLMAFPDPGQVPLLTLPTAMFYGLLGVVFILQRIEFGWFCRPFFSAVPQIRYYACSVLVLWFVAILLENMQNRIDLEMVVNDSVFLFLRALDAHLIVVTLFTIPVLFALHLLNMSESHRLLASSLQASLQHHHLVAAMLSHDLKAPLETEIAAIDMLAGSPTEHPMLENTRRILSAINDNNRFELDMVCNLLHLFRFGVQQADRFEPEPVNVSDLLYSVQSELYPMASRKSQALDVRSVPGSLMIYADRTGIKRVLHNLVNNAIKHLGSGHNIQVFVRYDKNSLVFSVKDDGPGLAPKTRDDLVTLFSEAPMPKTFNNRTTGLGIYVARQIVERHGGRIWIEPPDEKPGTHVSFSLPLRHAEVLTEQRERPVSRLSVAPALS